MKPAADTNSPSYTASLMAVFIAVFIAASANAANSVNAASSAKSYSGVIARQVTSWGIYDIKACPQGIRIHTQYGAILVAKPPDWTIYIFRNGEKKAAKLSYAMFQTKNPHAVKLSQIRQKPKTIRVAGMNATMYSFNINQKLEDTTMGSLYRSRPAQPIVSRKEVAFAPNTDFIPKQAKGIWSSFFEIPVVEEIPIETIVYLQNGEKRAYFDTKKFSRGTMTARDFIVPPGLSYTSQFAEMIYGKEMEGVADLLEP
jgi:hypothetical protein